MFHIALQGSFLTKQWVDQSCHGDSALIEILNHLRTNHDFFFFCGKTSGKDSGWRTWRTQKNPTQKAELTNPDTETNQNKAAGIKNTNNLI